MLVNFFLSPECKTTIKWKPDDPTKDIITPVTVPSMIQIDHSDNYMY